MKTVKFNNVGPISALSIPIPQRGGVVVLTGPNGSGKSTALRALGALATGSGTSELSVRDGELAGSIDGLGARISLGLGRKRGGVSGELECRSLDSGIDPSVLVDPGLKDPEAADARRIAMLCRLAGVKPDLALFSETARSAATPKVAAAEDLPSMAAALRRALHESALAKEREATQVAQEATTLQASIADVNLDAPSESDVRARLDAAAQNRAEKRAQAQAYQRASQAAEAARAIVERIREDGIEARRTDVDRARAALADAVGLTTSARDQLARAQENLQARLRDEEQARGLLSELTNDLFVMETESKQADEARRVLGTLDTLPNPSPEELAELDAEVASLTGDVGQAQNAERARKTAEKVERLRVQAVELQEHAKLLRAEAGATDNAVAASIARVAPMGLMVEAGRLVLTTSRGKTPWDELSHGERWRIALESAIAAVGEGGLLSIRQEAWEGLDPVHRVEIANLAEQRGVVVVTAEASDGELRAETFAPPSPIENVEG